MSMPTFPLALVPIAENWDPPGILLGKLAIIIALVGLNGFFVACEFAIVKVRMSQLDALAEEGNLRAQFARHVRSHLDAYLSATQLGITLASLALGWLGEQFLTIRYGRPLWLLVGLVLLGVHGANTILFTIVVWGGVCGFCIAG